MADLSNVYDLFFPSPASLKEFASIEIAMNLWRREIQQHLTEDGVLREREKKTSLMYLVTDLGLPLTILPTIERYVIEFAENISGWIWYHIEMDILKFEMLKYFLDFVCDFDGDIHYGKTAKRFVTCEGVSNEAKFRMACFYCLEDDIFRIWPEVSSFLTIDEVDSNLDSKLYYWVRRLRNQLHDIRVMLPDGVSCIEELILVHALDDLDEGDWPSQEYFLGRLPSNVRMKYMTSIGDLVEHADRCGYLQLEHVFFRHILVKLNETQLGKFIREKGDGLISLSQPSFLLHVWAYIKNKMSNDVFCRLIKNILNEQTNNSSKNDDTFYLCQLWISAPDQLKQAAIRGVLLVVDDTYFHRNDLQNNLVGIRRSVSFLLAVLSDMQLEDRRKFWNKHWDTIFIDIRPKDLNILIHLCFDYDNDEINRFKEWALSQNHKEINTQLSKILAEGFFKELEQFLIFWFPNEETIKKMSLKLLRDDFIISPELVCEASSLKKFIEYAYADEELATVFKNTLLVDPNFKAIQSIKSVISSGRHFCKVMEFIDTFAPSDQFTTQIKKQYIEPALESFSTDYFEDFVTFTNWLLESPEDILQFKFSWNVDALIRKLVTDKIDLVECKKMNCGGVDCDWFENCFQTRDKSASFLEKFLKWFFVTTEAAETFLNDNYAHDRISNIMLNRLLL